MSHLPAAPDLSTTSSQHASPLSVPRPLSVRRQITNHPFWGQVEQGAFHSLVCHAEGQRSSARSGEAIRYFPLILLGAGEGRES